MRVCNDCIFTFKLKVCIKIIFTKEKTVVYKMWTTVFLTAIFTAIFQLLHFEETHKFDAYNFEETHINLNI